MFSLKRGPLVKRPKTPPFHGGYTGSNPVRVTTSLVRNLWDLKDSLIRMLVTIVGEIKGD